MRSLSAWSASLVLVACLASCRRASPEAGYIVFSKYCAGCHSGRTTQAFAPAIAGYLRVQKHKEAETRRIIREGKGNMPPFGRRLSRRELDDLMAYLKRL